MTKLNLSDAAKLILSEDSKSTFDGNISSKMGMRGQSGNKPEVGKDRVSSKTAYGTNDAGMIGQSPERSLTDELPDYTKGTPSATPPGATPPVSSEPMKKLSPQPQQTMGRSDIATPVKSDATDYEAIRDRIAGKMAPQMMDKMPGSTFQQYEETEEEEEEILEERKEKMAAKMKAKMKEDIDALMDGENLSEEFVNKATTIFEAAVISRAEEVIALAEEELLEQFDEAIEIYKEELTTKLDNYLDYMVEEWVKENQIAIETGLRGEIVEDFINGLHSLFKEHYINIPEEKVDVIEELTDRVEELEESLNYQILSAVEMKKELNEHKKFEAIYAACESLTQTQVEKLKSLAESIEFTTEEDFTEKLETLKESYFKESVKSANSYALDDEVQIEEEKPKKVGSTDALMEQYSQAISKTILK